MEAVRRVVLETRAVPVACLVALEVGVATVAHLVVHTATVPMEVEMEEAIRVEVHLGLAPTEAVA